jgi:CO/xanthine dehydrogenase Mo-binding subunit
VLTGADYRTDGLGSLPSMAPYKRRSGGAMFLPLRPAIAFDRVMHVGSPVAVVVADALDQARDAAERVVVDYEPRPGVVSARDAFAPNAPQLYDECRNNEAYFYQAGDNAKVDAAFGAAAHIVEERRFFVRGIFQNLVPWICSGGIARLPERVRDALPRVTGALRRLPLAAQSRLRARRGRSR